MGLKVIQNSCFLSIYLAFPPVSAYFSFEEILRINSLPDDSPLKSWGGKNNPYKQVGFQNKFRICQVNL